jgi:hypothetical protein
MNDREYGNRHGCADSLRSLGTFVVLWDKNFFTIGDNGLPVL